MDLPDNQDELFEKAQVRAIKFLSFRPRSQKEITDFLIRKGFPKEIISKNIEFLNEQKFINDLDFAKWWITQRQEFKAKSKSIIMRELLIKGVSKEVIKEALKDSLDDFGVAYALFEKQKHKFKNYKGREYYKKTTSYLQRKGFNWEIIEKILKKV